MDPHSCQPQRFVFPQTFAALRPYVGLVCCALGLAGATSCASVRSWTTKGWLADYDAAEEQVRERGAPLLIYYSDTPIRDRDPLGDLQKDATVAGRFREYVCCRLYKSHEPDRRYAAQYGVERVPAWIVVHPDGTYQARAGLLEKSDLIHFLSEPTAPRAQPELNPLIPREARYAWHENLHCAQAAAEASGQPVFAVYHRRMGRDWRKLRELLERPEVYSRLSKLVPCRIELWDPWKLSYITGFGVLQLPALVIAHRDGSYHTLERPTSYETIVRFLDQHARPPATTSARPTASAEEP